VLAVRLEPLLGAAQARAGVVMTDIRGHWATPWILAVVRAGVMEPLPNHTFEPAQRVRRADFAQIVHRVLTLAAARNPAMPAGWRGARVSIADLPATHPAYPAVSAAVAAGVLALSDAGQFEPGRPVTGRELVDAVARLESVAGIGTRRR
jgi:hypothetical protein